MLLYKCAAPGEGGQSFIFEGRLGRAPPGVIDIRHECRSACRRFRPHWAQPCRDPVRRNQELRPATFEAYLHLGIPSERRMAQRARSVAVQADFGRDDGQITRLALGTHHCYTPKDELPCGKINCKRTSTREATKNVQHHVTIDRIAIIRSSRSPSLRGNRGRIMPSLEALCIAPAARKRQ